MSYFGTSALTPLDDNMFVSSALSRKPTFSESIGPLMERGIRQTYGIGTAVRAGEALGFTSQVSELDERRMTEEAWKASPYYREGVQYSTGMTEGRAKRIAEARDADAVREWYAGQRPWTALLTGLAGGFADPINYIPVVSQFGQGAGLAARIGLSAADAALNTGAAAVLTARLRAQLGDDVSEGEVLRQMAYSAVAGAVLGGAFHLIGNRRAAFEAGQTQAAKSQSAIILNNLADNEATGRADIWPATRDAVEQINKLLREAQDRFDYKMEEFRVTAVEDGVMRVEAIEPPGIRVYHGSPHNFDRFSMEHIGKGEGAQAFGHGLYFAESEGVAKTHAEGVTGNMHFAVEGALRKANRDVDVAIANTQADMAKWLAPDAAADPRTKQWAETARGVLDELQVLKETGSLRSGTLYEARIKANPDDFLDWDKPLSEQGPKVQALAEQMKGKSFLARKALERPDATGRDVWEKSRNTFVTGGGVGNDAAASAMFREAGIPGIKYLDGNSRSAGEGTLNYVVFDDSLIEVTAKNGQPVTPKAAAFDLSTNWETPAWYKTTDGSNVDIGAFQKIVDDGNKALADVQPALPFRENPVHKQFAQDFDNWRASGIDVDTGITPFDAQLKEMQAAGVVIPKDDLAALEIADREVKSASVYEDVLKVINGCVRNG